MRVVRKCVAFAALIASSGSARAEPIAIMNPGFGADFVNPGCFAVFAPTGWTPYDPFGILNGNNNSVGVLDPTGTAFFPAGAPEGDTVGIVYLEATIGAGPAGLSQELGAVLEPATIYRLSVQVGDIASGTGAPPCDVFGFYNLNGFPGYRVELLAGDEVLGADDNSLAAVLGEGEFALSTLRAAVASDDPQIGQPLEIRLINLNEAETPAGPGIEVDFDAVELDATPVDSAALLDLAQCLSGPDITPTCPADFNFTFDLDNDGDLDLADFATVSALP